MAITQKNIAIIAGGDSSEREVSFRSAEGIFSFIKNTDYKKFNVRIIGKEWNVILSDETKIPIDKNDFSFILNGKKINFDFAYITIHGTPGENGILQGYFELLQIPYSCCGVLAAALTFNKYVCNNFLKNFGINVAESVLVKNNSQEARDEIIEKLGLPVFVKPAEGGSSFGVTKAETAEQLQPAIDKAFAEGNEVIIERYIESFKAKTEFTCGMYKTKETTTIFPVFEVKSDYDFFNYDAKYMDRSREFPATSISAEKQKEIQQITAKIYDLLNAKGIVRVDYIVEKNGKIVLLDVNTTPGMTTQSFIPQMAEEKISDVMTEIIENEISNYNKRSA